MTTASSQPYILAPSPLSGLSLSYALANGADAHEALRGLAAGFEPGWGTVGIGEPLTRAIGRQIPGLRPFPAMSAPGCGVPSTQQPLWILVAAADQGGVFDIFRKVEALAAEAFVLTDSMPTFIYTGHRDLTGYEDGTENPKGKAAAAAAIVEAGPGETGRGLAGSSFAAVQRWEHDLDHFNSHPEKVRDAMMGRRRRDNAELPRAPATAHVKRSTQEDFDPPAFMMRRSMPWATVWGQGLEFIAYGRSLDAYERVMRRMAGLDDGIVDASFAYSRPVTGGYYWCPPVRSGKLDLRILGLQV
ncbi:MAG: Dyp-type peroxidase [Reyranella sp.]|nr:Dyp-type peroxidase [Reyranella sp.]